MATEPLLFLCHGYGGISGLFLIGKGHHGRAVLHLVIPLAGAAPVKNVDEESSVRLFHSVLLRSVFKEQIQIFPVNARYARSIRRLFHSSFDFQGGHTGFQNLRQNFDG